VKQLPRTPLGRLATVLFVAGLLLAAAALLTLPTAQAQRKRAATARHEAAGLLARLGHRSSHTSSITERVPAPTETLIDAARRALTELAGPLKPRVATRRIEEDAEFTSPAGITVEPISLSAAAGLLNAVAADPALPGLTADHVQLVAPAPGRWRLEITASVPAP